jgi:hypothetical protein
MRFNWSYLVVLSSALLTLVDALKVQLTPSNLTPLVAEGFQLWSVAQEAATSTAKFDGVTLQLTGVSDTLNGGRNKIVSTLVINQLGQWLVGAGVSTSTQNGRKAIQLTVTGLSAGTHSLLVYHNAWDNLSAVSPIDVAVNGKTVKVLCLRDFIENYSDITLSRVQHLKLYEQTVSGVQPLRI